MTVLLRSRSLMKGIFHHGGNSEDFKEGKGINRHACVITHSPSATTLADWEDDDSHNYQCSDAAIDEPPTNSEAHLNLPPIIDDCTELDHSRRVETAESHGFTFDEAHGVESILHALTPHERQFLADDNMPLRHYRAEKGNLNEAIRKIKSTLKWREEFAVEDIKRCFDKNTDGLSHKKREELNQLAGVIAQENETGKIYCRGYDKEGRAILYLTPGKENSTNEWNNMRHLVYHLERAIACTRRKSGREKVCIVIRYQGFKLRNAPPISTVKHTLTILQSHYPERMYRAYICDPPFVFRSFWNIIKHFIDPATLEKIAFCAGKEGNVVLERDFDTSTTEKQAGGTTKLREFCSKEFLFGTLFHWGFDEKQG
eukprot:CAMPEP_0172329822 /NCGR_PEP_ID=MMETSP1058-20130122/61082_1 /TAXON_ID=83371 /ORGANISM="Detonula confervacea, Strain CCMP 353" /LENGTH=370 /DNA_ID=CAMNT_0013047013 /DNA_START=28 /DNA_END=1140 /DNA_ORIENTATION=+